MEDNKVIRLTENFFKNHDNFKISNSRGYATFNEGMCFYRQEKDKLALEKFKQAEQEGYVSADMFSYMGYIYYAEIEDNDTAEYYVKKSIKIDKEYGYPYRLLALIYQDDYEKALKYNLLAEKYKYNENSSMMRHIAELYSKIEKKNQLKAIEYATKAIDLEPKNPFNWYFKGWVYYTDCDWVNVIKYYQKAEEKGYLDSEFYFEYSYAYSELNNPQKAVEYANKYIFTDKEGFSGYYRKGYAYLLCDKREAALESFLIAEKKGCDVADMYSQVSFIYAKLKEYDKSLEYSDKALKYDKSFADAYWMKAIIFNGLYDFKMSLKFLKKARKIYESYGGHLNEDGYYILAATYSILRKPKLAIQTVNEGLEYYPQDKNLLVCKVFYLQSTKKYEEADELFNEYFSNYEGNDDLINSYLAGIIYNRNEKIKDYDRILYYLDKVCDVELINEQKNLKGYCYYEKKEYEKSLQLMYEYAKNTDVAYYKALKQGEFRKYIRRLVKIFGKDEERLKFIIDKFSIEVK